MGYFFDRLFSFVIHYNILFVGVTSMGYLFFHFNGLFRWVTLISYLFLIRYDRLFQGVTYWYGGFLRRWVTYL